MFSLIVTIVSIVLVAVLATAALYYGGSGYTAGHARVVATKIVVQSQQILAANDLFLTEHGRHPLSVQELVDGKYLEAVPVAQAPQVPALITSAWADEPSRWSMPRPGTPVYALTANVTTEVCQEVNLKGALRQQGILKKAYPDLALQCYGETTEQLTVVASRNSMELVAAMPSDVAATPVPNSPDSSDWLVPPGAKQPQGEAADPLEPEAPAIAVAPSLSCTGIYTKAAVSATCTVTADPASATRLQQVSATANPFYSASMSADSCINQLIPAGESCTFSVNGNRPGSANTDLTLNVMGTYGESGLGNDMQLTANNLTYSGPLQRRVTKVLVREQGVWFTWDSANNNWKPATSTGLTSYIMPDRPVMNPAKNQQLHLVGPDFEEFLISGGPSTFGLVGASYKIVQNGQDITPPNPVPLTQQPPPSFGYEIGNEVSVNMRRGALSRYAGKSSHADGPAVVTFTFPDGSEAEIDILIEEPPVSIVQAPAITGGTLVVNAPGITTAAGRPAFDRLFIVQPPSGCSITLTPDYSVPGQLSAVVPNLTVGGYQCSPGLVTAEFRKTNGETVVFEAVEFQFNLTP